MNRPLARTAPKVGIVLASTLLCSAGVLRAQDYGFVFVEWPAAPITGLRGLDHGSCQVGYYQSDAADFNTAQAIRRCDGVMTQIDPPTSTADRRAFGINDAGTVVGSAMAASALGWELIGGSYSWVSYPGSTVTTVRGINEAGDIAGEYDDSSDVRHAFTRIGGVFANVDVPGGVSSRARGINDLGEVAGHWDDALGVRHGFLRSPTGVYTTVDHPGATATLLSGINNAGEATGVYFDASGDAHGFLVTDSGLVPFEVPGAVAVFPTDINDFGQVVGEFVDALGVTRGFVASPILFGDGFESGDTNAWSP